MQYDATPFMVPSFFKTHEFIIYSNGIHGLISQKCAKKVEECKEGTDGDDTGLHHCQNPSHVSLNASVAGDTVVDCLYKDIHHLRLSR